MRTMGTQHHTCGRRFCTSCDLARLAREHACWHQLRSGQHPTAQIEHGLTVLVVEDGEATREVPLPMGQDRVFWHDGVDLDLLAHCVEWAIPLSFAALN